MLTHCDGNGLVFGDQRVALPPGVTAAAWPTGVRLDTTRQRDGAALGLILPTGHTTPAAARAFVANMQTAAAR